MTHLAAQRRAQPAAFCGPLSFAPLARASTEHTRRRCTKASGTASSGECSTRPARRSTPPRFGIFGRSQRPRSGNSSPFAALRSRHARSRGGRYHRSGASARLVSPSSVSLFSRRARARGLHCASPVCVSSRARGLLCLLSVSLLALAVSPQRRRRRGGASFGRRWPTTAVWTLRIEPRVAPSTVVPSRVRSLARRPGPIERDGVVHEDGNGTLHGPFHQVVISYTCRATR